MNKKYVIIGAIAAAALVGGLYYYGDDMMTLIDFTSKKEEIKDFSKKKIKKTPVKINIENLDEL